MTTENAVQSSYLGSVGIYSPLFNNLLSSWTGINPDTGNKVKLRNYSDVMEYKIFQISDFLSMEGQEAVFVSEEHAKMLLSRGDIPDDAPDAEEQKRIINDAVESNKTGGSIITIRYGAQGSWAVPGQVSTMKTLVDAFDFAADRKCHVRVNIAPNGFDTQIKWGAHARAMRVPLKMV